VDGNNEHQSDKVAAGGGSAFHPSQNAVSAGSITYAATKVSSLVPWVFMGIGALFIGVGLLFTIVFLFVFPPIALVFLLFSLFGVVFVALGGWRWYSNRQQRLQLTPQALVSFSRGKRFQLPLAEISGISAREGVYWAKDPLSQVDIQTQHRYWIARIETRAGNYLDLDVTQGGYIGLFDVPRVLRDLLPRLPTSVQVDPRIQSYLATGRIA
jgi:hypothetical protein